MTRNFKTTLWTSLLVVLLGISNFASGNELVHNEVKIYVSPGTVYVAPNGLYANIEGILMPVNSISVDVQGVFVIMDFEAAGGKPQWCPLCRGYHLPGQGCPQAR